MRLTDRRLGKTRASQREREAPTLLAKRAPQPGWRRRLAARQRGRGTTRVHADASTGL